MSRFLLTGLACLLAACGQKGPLYLPAPVPAPALSSPSPAPSDEQDKKDAKDTPAAIPQP